MNCLKVQRSSLVSFGEATPMIWSILVVLPDGGDTIRDESQCLAPRDLDESSVTAD